MSTAAAPVPAGAEISGSEITSTLVSSHSSLSNPSSSSSSSNSDSDSDSDDSSDEEAETTARLKALLLKAKASARAKAESVAKGKTGDGLAGQDEVVLFGGEADSDDEEDGTPKPSSSNSHLPPSLVRPLHLRAPTATELGKGKAKEVRLTLAQDIGGSMMGSSGSGDKWGRAPLPSLSKAQQKARHPPTAGPKWFDLPAPTMTPELKREIQAMRLRNALDPKRFYKGGAKDNKALPEFFALGHVMPSTTSASTAQAAVPRKRTFVEELVDDEQARAYTKKKFVNEVMVRGMSGRGRSKKGAGKGKGGRVR